MEEQEFLNANEAAEYLGVHRQRVYQLIREKGLGRKIAGYWVFTKAELDAYLQAPKGPGGRPKVDAGTLTLASPAV